MPSHSLADSQAKDEVSRKGYVIGAGDVLAINVWREPEMSQSVPVRPDGKISIPLVGDLQASGLTPTQLQSEVTQKLKAYISNPQVTVILTEVKSRRFSVVGAVLRPGSYDLPASFTVLDAIALAGGFSPFAKVKKIYVLRVLPDSSTQRFLFNYKQVLKGEHMKQNFELMSGDTVVVP